MVAAAVAAASAAVCVMSVLMMMLLRVRMLVVMRCGLLRCLVHRLRLWLVSRAFRGAACALVATRRAELRRCRRSRAERR